jgi:hypothetical protein
MAKQRLNHPNDVRRFLAKLANDLVNGRVDASVAGKTAYILNILLKALEISFNQDTIFTLQQRLDSLETRLGED